MEDFKEKYRKETREYVHFRETESGSRLYDESYVDWLEQQLKNCNLQNVMQRRELLKFAEWEKGKNLLELYEWDGAAGILMAYLEECGIDVD